MKKPKLNLRGLTVLQKIQKSAALVEAMSGNPGFPAPNPPLPEIEQAAAEVAAAFSEREQLRKLLQHGQTVLEAAEQRLDLLLTALAAYVTVASAGSEQMIVSSGMEVANPPVPVGPLPQVANLRAAAGVAEGSVLLRWKRLRHARCYEVQISPDPVTSQSWQSAATIFKAKCPLAGLTSGARLWFRVRAIGSAGPGPWSNPVAKTVP